VGFIKRIKEEVAIIRQRDPAIHSAMEVFLYPSFKVMMHYRTAHKLYLNRHYFLARWVSQRGARKTGIEIHPGAQIGRGFFISAGNEPSGMPNIWRLPRGSNTPLLCSAASLIPRCLQRGL